jgi:alpha-1,6-mannosyltransferase
LLASWGIFGVLIALFGVGLTLVSRRFGYEYEVAEMPVAWVVAGLVLAGAAYALFLPPLIRGSLAGEAAPTRPILVGIVAGGVAARLVLLASEPILEDDYQRYLWDGAVTANGNNPYAVSPEDALQLGEHTELGRFAREAATLVGRINHPELRTIYPPVAQAAFALAHLVRPWSLLAWRSVLLACDLATLLLILLLLRECGRSPLWSALYWWNPVVIKELFNSAHMDAVVLPFVLGALLLATRKRYVLAVTSLGLAAGAKIWPVVLLPLVIRPLSTKWQQLAPALGLFGAMMTLWAVPILLGGLDEHSGFVAYVSSWQTNSAHFPALERAIASALDFVGLPETHAGLLGRAVVAILLVCVVLAVNLKPLESSADLVNRACIIVAALVLLSPAQYPWYYVWFAPFLAFQPWLGFLVLTATIPLYYAFFHLSARQQAEMFEHVVVWIIWIPVWGTVVLDAVRRRRGDRPI